MPKVPEVSFENYKRLALQLDAFRESEDYAEDAEDTLLDALDYIWRKANAETFKRIKEWENTPV